MLPFGHLKKSNTIDNLWFYILILAEKESVYAYKVRKDIWKNFSFNPGMVSSYRVLYRLEIEGFVKSEMTKRKRIYKITKKGREELKRARGFYRKMLKI